VNHGNPNVDSHGLRTRSIYLFGIRKIPDMLAVYNAAEIRTGFFLNKRVTATPVCSVVAYFNKVLHCKWKASNLAI
jgi:hypothetical protein